MVGHAQADIYPFRARMNNYVQAGLVPGAASMQHPGYVSPTQSGARAVQSDYFKQLRSAKLCIFDTSVFRYAVRKFVEVGVCLLFIVSGIWDAKRLLFFGVLVFFWCSFFLFLFFLLPSTNLKMLYCFGDLGGFGWLPRPCRPAA